MVFICSQCYWGEEQVGTQGRWEEEYALITAASRRQEPQGDTVTHQTPEALL